MISLLVRVVGFWFRVVRSGFVGSYFAADVGVGPVNGLEHVKIELLARWNADVKTVSSDRLVDSLGVRREHLLRSLERRVVKRWTVQCAKHRLFLLGEGVGGAAEERGGEHF